MTSIDEIARTAAADLRAEIRPLVDPARGLERIRSEGSPPSLARRISPRIWIALGSAAAVIVAVVAVVALRDDSTRTITVVPGSELDTTPSPTQVTPPATTIVDNTPTTVATAATVATGAATSTVVLTSPSTSPSTMPSSTTATVSYKDPPPTFTPRIFASMQLAPPAGPVLSGEISVAVGQVAVTPTGVVVVDSIAATADVIDWTGKRTVSVPLLDGVPSSVIAGPGDVLYGLAPTTNGSGLLRMVAIALNGPSAGHIIESADVASATYTELPIGAFGHGPNGIIDRVRDVGAQLIAYVDASGRPLVLDGSSNLSIDAQNTVRMDGGPTWPLDIQRDPNSPGSYFGPTPPAPSANGGAVYWTSIGPPSSPETSGGDAVATVPVVAALYADGSAQWWSLSDEWFVAASDQWGTVLAHATQDAFELALFPDDAGRYPSKTGSTATTATTAPAACVKPDGQTIAGPIAGSQLMILSTTSVSGPVVGVLQAAAGSPPAAVLGPVAISADGSTIAAAIDRRGPDDIMVSRDRGATWATVGTSVDAEHLALEGAGSTLAVSSLNTITLYSFGGGRTNRDLALPPGTVAVDALAFRGTQQLAVAFESGPSGSDVATPGHIFTLQLTTGSWTQAPDTPSGPVLITSMVATPDEISYLAVDASTNAGGTGAAQLWRIHADKSVTLQATAIPGTDTLVGYSDARTTLLAEYDDTGTYRIVRRAGGDQQLTIGCIRPAAGTDLINGDPDIR